MSNLAYRLAEARAESGMTQPELAKKAGVKNASTIGMLESGARLKSSYIPAIAIALGVEALWLAEEIGPKYRGVLPVPTPTAAAPAQDPAMDDLASLLPEEQILWRSQLKAAAERRRAEQAEKAAAQAEKAELMAMMHALLASQQPTSEAKPVPQAKKAA